MMISYLSLSLTLLCTLHTSSTRDLTVDDYINRLKSMLFQQVYSEMTELDRDSVNKLDKINHHDTDVDTPGENVVMLTPSPSPYIDPVYARTKELMYSLNQVFNALQGFKGFTDPENNKQQIDALDLMSGNINECIKNLQDLKDFSLIKEELDFSKRNQNKQDEILEDYNKAVDIFLNNLQSSSKLSVYVGRFKNDTKLPTKCKIDFLVQIFALTNEFYVNIKYTSCLNLTKLDEFQNRMHTLNETLKTIKKKEDFPSGIGGSNTGGTCENVKQTKPAFVNLVSDIVKCCKNQAPCLK